MTVQAMIYDIAGGTPTHFGDYILATTETVSGFGTVTTNVEEWTDNGLDVQDGIIKLAGGRKYNPWGLAGRKAPTTYGSYTVNIIMHGDVEACQRRYQLLKARAGETMPLRFSYGRLNETGGSSDYGPKACQAMLTRVSAPFARTQATSDKTWFRVVAVFEQTGPFYPTQQ